MDFAANPFVGKVVLGANTVRVALGSMILFPRVIRIHTLVPGPKSNFVSLVIQSVLLELFILLPKQRNNILKRRGEILTEFLAP